MPEFERPTVTLHYEDAGAARPGQPALVFLHGWCESSADWLSTMAAFRGEYRCIAPDMRGCGRSGMPRDHAYGPEPLSNDVVELCRSLGIEKPVLIGHSYGGYLAAEIARRFPGFPLAVVVEDQQLDLREFGTRVRQLESVIRSPESHMAFRLQLIDSLAGPNLDPAVLASIRRGAEKTPVEVGQALWAALFEFSPMELAKRSDALMAALSVQPALSIDAEEPPGYYDTLHWFAPNARTRVIHAGHWIHLEKPQEFQTALRELLALV